mmetsp:Transcript_9370/g.20937  ORF Transcript_9370/g.20937 Transcript_9370/m.20937 type:complete len:489 (+) Transcript_9370:222-1688(+)
MAPTPSGSTTGSAGSTVSDTIRSNIASTYNSLSTLLSVPVLIIITIAALDHADKGLLASSFPMLEKQLGMDVKTLGYFSLFTNLSYSLSLPLWGWAVHRYGIVNAPTILAASCLLWGMSCMCIAASDSVLGQAVFRSINGSAISSILPLSQTLLVQVVPNPGLHGRAFGLMGLAERLANTVASASVIWFDDWKHPYIAVGLLSIVAAVLSRQCLHMRNSDHHDEHSDDDSQDKKKMSLGQIVRRIARIPAFLCLVGQGVFGGIPWDMMSFLLLLFEWRGFTREQIVSLQFSQGISCTIGAPIGGFLGDRFSHLPRGRIYVAMSSIILGTFSYAAFVFSTTFSSAFFFCNVFHVVAGWVTAAANRPICAELAQNPSERAQIVAMWVLLEKTSAAVFGAPLVGYLTSGMIDEDAEKGVADPQKADALAYNLFFLSTLFWAACCFFWTLMAYNIEPDLIGSKKEGNKLDEHDDEEDAALLVAASIQPPQMV